MLDLFEIVDYSDLERAVDEDLVDAQKHPNYELSIYNYTHKAQVTKGAWDNPAVRTCRGVIVDENGEIVSRAFPKFFNLGQQEAPEFGLHEKATVLDKVDGSLGILYWTPEGPAIATRGSFASEQALHATKVLLRKYKEWTGWVKKFNGDQTFLFEIVYPENRIVLNYGDMDDLVFLGVVDNATGSFRQWRRNDSWPGPKTAITNHANLDQALKAPPRDNAEGFVVVSQDGARMVKIKQEDYLRLHKIVSNLSEKTIWENLSEGSIEELREIVPDEWLEWVDSVVDDLNEKAFSLLESARDAHDEAMAEVMDEDGGIDRKEYAEYAKTKRGVTTLMFALLDGKDIMSMIWKRLKPKSEAPLVDLEE